MFDWILKLGCFFLGLMSTPIGLFILFSEKGLFAVRSSRVFRRSSMIAIFGQDFTQIATGLFWLISGLFLLLIGLAYKPPPDPPDE